MKLLPLAFVPIFLLGCSQEDAFMRFSDDVHVINVSGDSISVNGAHRPVGEVLAGGSPKNIHIRVDGNETYGNFYKVLVAIASSGRSLDMRFVIGDNFRDSILVYRPRQNDECQNATKGLLKIALKRHKNEAVSAEDLQQVVIDEAECKRKYLKPSVSVEEFDGSLQFSLGESHQGFSVYSTEEDFLDALEKMQSRDDLRQYVDRDQLTFVTNNSMPMGKIAGIVTALTNRQYKIKFAQKS